MASFGTTGGRLIVVLVIVALAAAVAVFHILPRSPLTTQVVQQGLEHPWDIAFADDGQHGVGVAQVVGRHVGEVLDLTDDEPRAEIPYSCRSASCGAGSMPNSSASMSAYSSG